MKPFAIAAVIALALTGQAHALTPAPNVAEPSVRSTPALNGAALVTLKDANPAATLYYTTDGSEPTLQSQRYEAPFLVTDKVTVRALAVVSGLNNSENAAVAGTSGIASGTLVWADEFDKPGVPDPKVWGYDTGHSGFGNHELETYCTATSAEAPCDPASPNASVGSDGLLHIVARQVSPGVYTSARMKSEGLFSFRYGRVEVRARVPEAQGFWPAFWAMGNNIRTVGWPADGEMDILERVNAATTPDWNEGSIHGTGFTGEVGLGTRYMFPAGQTAADWHTYGMIWKPGSVAYYIDDPAHPYVTYTQADLAKLPGSVWPFDAGQSNFLLLNLAIGGDWPKAPDATAPFPAEMQVDYVRIYTY